MLKIVLDTNIIISAALSPNGTPAKILSLIGLSYDLQLLYNNEILTEYKNVLSRQRLNIASDIQNRIINTIINAGIIANPAASNFSMPDETDRVFYDIAKTNDAILVTGNIKHYPTESFVKTPTDFLSFIYI